MGTNFTIGALSHNTRYVLAGTLSQIAADLPPDHVRTEKLLDDAEASSRKRSHYNIHQDSNEPVQRLCIGLKKGTYIRPHCHKAPNNWEMIIILKGEVALLVFDSKGVVEKRYNLSARKGSTGIQLQPNTWHMLYPISSDAVIFEVKEGPYQPDNISQFADWSPEEGSEDVDSFLAWASMAEPGDKYRQPGVN